jgi:2-C-methyl-D-erythritol 2,4-cyclodiphosphate synthase
MRVLFVNSCIRGKASRTLRLCRAAIEQMKETLAPILGVAPRRVGVKATTNEKLGALGRREGMAAFATVAVQVPDED